MEGKEDLVDLVGTEKMEEISQSRVKCKPGSEIFIWKLSNHNIFNTASAWDVSHSKSEHHI